jgi:hypothetical protein
LGIILVLFVPSLLHAQNADEDTPIVTTQVTGEGIDLPAIKGFNFVLTSTSQYDGVSGWSSAFSPVLSFRLNDHLSFDTGLPFYVAVNATLTKGTKAAPIYVPTTAHGVIGDTGVSGHLDFSGDWLSYSLTATGAFPTGNSQDSLSANTETYAINNHFEGPIGKFTPDIELGEGDSSSLTGAKVRRSYVAVGPLAFFQAGTTVDLPHTIGLDFEAYESMPIGNQNVYGTLKTKKGKTKTVLEGTGVAEDNGINAAFSCQPNSHFGFSVFYNRSFRQYDNTTGFSLTYTTRAPKPAPVK